MNIFTSQFLILSTPLYKIEVATSNPLKTKTLYFSSKDFINPTITFEFNLSSKLQVKTSFAIKSVDQMIRILWLIHRRDIYENSTALNANLKFDSKR